MVVSAGGARCAGAGRAAPGGAPAGCLASCPEGHPQDKSPCLEGHLRDVERPEGHLQGMADVSKGTFRTLAAPLTGLRSEPGAAPGGAPAGCLVVGGV